MPYADLLEGHMDGLGGGYANNPADLSDGQLDGVLWVAPNGRDFSVGTIITPFLILEIAFFFWISRRIIYAFPKWTKRVVTPLERVGLVLMVSSCFILMLFLSYCGIATQPLVYAETVNISNFNPRIKQPVDAPEGKQWQARKSGWALYDIACLQDRGENIAEFHAPPDIYERCRERFVSNETTQLGIKFHHSFDAFIKGAGFYIWVLVVGLFTAGAAMYGGFADSFIKWIKQGNC